MLDDDLNSRATEAQAKAAQAYARLLHMAETGQGGQTEHVARFVAGTYNGDTFPFDCWRQPRAEPPGRHLREPLSKTESLVLTWACR